MFVVVSYDIVNNNKRNKVSELLLDYGRRVQKSVFECELDEKKLDEMIKEAIGYINQEEDSLRIYHLCESCIPKIVLYGRQIDNEQKMIV